MAAVATWGARTCTKWTLRIPRIVRSEAEGDWPAAQALTVFSRSAAVGDL